MIRRRKTRINNVTIFSYIFLGIASVLFLFPMYLAVVVSISSEESIINNGYRLWPDEFSLESYKLLITHYGSSLIRSLALTIGTGILQPLLSIFLTMCMAYPLSQQDFKGKEFWRKFLIVTMLFSGGLVPGYILNTRFLGLKDTVFIYMIPGIGAWNVFLFRTFFVSIDKSMVESAKIDGANKMQILLRIMLPLTKALVAMNFFSGFLARWNDITTGIYYITDRKLYTIQYLLQQMLRDASEAKTLIKMGLSPGLGTIDIPIESVRFAFAVIGAIPVFVLFPLLQKYYAKGITLGSTKG